MTPRARDEILARLHAVSPTRPPAVAAVPLPRRAATTAPEPPLDEWVRRVRELGATVTPAPPDGVGAAVAAVWARHGSPSLVVPAGLPRTWTAAIAAVVDEPAVDLARLAAVGGVVTGCAAAVAATGTIVLDGGRGQGRRALTLLPDLHICVVLAEQVVDDLPEAFAGLAAGLARRAPLTFITGPSATSDIELQRVAGVHGPRRLEVVAVSG